MKPSHVIFLLIPVFLTSCGDPGNHNSEESGTVIERYQGPVIDMHIHAYDANSMYGLIHPPTLRGQTFQGVKNADELRKGVFERFEKHNIVKAVVTNGQLWQDDSPAEVIIAHSNQPVDSLRKYHLEGKLQVIAEMAPFYAAITADHPSQDPYFAVAEELNVPVGFHIFPGGPNSGIHLMPEMLGGMRVYNANPVQIEDVLIKYPNLRLYIMHGGWPYTDEVKALMYAHPNVYVDIAVLNWLLPKEELYEYIKSLMRAGFGDRIMHGSDQMVWPDVIDVAIETVNSADFLTLEQKEDIFFDNAADFLELNKEEISTLKKKVY